MMFDAHPFWATGDSIMEAADLLVNRAVENANIAGRDAALNSLIKEGGGF